MVENDINTKTNYWNEISINELEDRSKCFVDGTAKLYLGGNERGRYKRYIKIK